MLLAKLLSVASAILDQDVSLRKKLEIHQNKSDFAIGKQIWLYLDEICKGVLLKNWKIKPLLLCCSLLFSVDSPWLFAEDHQIWSVFCCDQKRRQDLIVVTLLGEDVSLEVPAYAHFSPQHTLRWDNDGGHHQQDQHSHICHDCRRHFFSLFHFPRSMSQAAHTQVREMSPACCDKSSVTLETNPISVPWQIRTCCRCGGVSRTGRLGWERERKTEAPNPQVVRWPKAHSLTLGGEASSLKGSS